MEPPRIPRSLHVRRSRTSRDADERFARAVEAGEADRRGEFADELAIVAALRDLGNRGAGTAAPDVDEHGAGEHRGVASGDERDGSLTPAARIRITDRVLAPDPESSDPRSSTHRSSTHRSSTHRSSTPQSPDPRFPAPGSPVPQSLDRQSTAPGTPARRSPDRQSPDTEPNTTPSPAALRTVEANPTTGQSAATGQSPATEGNPATERKVGPPSKPRPASRPGRDRTGPRRRRTPAVAAGAAALVATAGVALGASDDARPGESLYALKQLREDASLAMTFDAEERAFQQLGYASDRITELRSLADDGALDRTTLHAGLTDFTDDTRAAVAELTALATTSGGEQLDRIRTWAGDEAARIAPVPGAAAGTELLSRVEQRALALDERMSCLRITSGGADDLGVLPTTGTCRTAPQAGPADEPSPVPPPHDDQDSDDGQPRDVPTGDDAATFVGSGPEHAGESADVATPVRATPPWTPASRVPPAQVVRAVPEPPTGPRLPDERPRHPGEFSLSTILAGITGLDSPRD
ncbi:hypothetical protein LY13_001625 [Prauserella aidingensis]|nr:hypothetical protein [Prauserella aidingensis]